jgi:hypothetical protein
MAAVRKEGLLGACLGLVHLSLCLLVYESSPAQVLLEPDGNSEQGSIDIEEEEA